MEVVIDQIKNYGKSEKKVNDNNNYQSYNNKTSEIKDATSTSNFE
jgi:hypothetical protein